MDWLPGSRPTSRSSGSAHRPATVHRNSHLEGVAGDSAAAARRRTWGRGLPASFVGATGRREASPGRRRAGRGSSGRRRTYRVVLEHAHGRRRSRARELVEEARHGHREEPHRDDTGFHCSRAGCQYCPVETPGENWGGRGRVRTFLGHGFAVRVVVAVGDAGVGADDVRRARLDFGTRMG